MFNVEYIHKINVEVLSKGGQDDMNTKDMILKSLGGRLRFVLSAISEENFEQLEEIRIRIQRPLSVKSKSKEYFLTAQGSTTKEIVQAYCPQAEEIQTTLELLSRFSLYAFEEEIKNGFITIEGGHRIGITGKVTAEDGKIKAIRNISALNIRISHEIKGCGDSVLPYMVENGQVLHTLIVSPPGCGKTTLLRDLVRQISNGKEGLLQGQNVGVVDERGEVAGCYQGVAQNDVGIRTDILDCCPKAEGMLLLVRSMSPQIIAVDEIGADKDIYAIESILNSGVRFIGTIHGTDLEDILKKPLLEQVLKKNIFERFIVLEKKNRVGVVKGIYNASFKPIHTEEEKT